MPHKVMETMEQYIHRRTLELFEYLLSCPESDLKVLIDMYNRDDLVAPMRWALEAIEQMSG